MDILTILLLLAMGAVVYSFLCGVSTMATNHEVAHGDAGQWMIRRVAFQALAIAVVLFAALVA